MPPSPFTSFISTYALISLNKLSVPRFPSFLSIFIPLIITSPFLFFLHLLHPSSKLAILPLPCLVPLLPPLDPSPFYLTYHIIFLSFFHLLSSQSWHIFLIFHISSLHFLQSFFHPVIHASSTVTIQTELWFMHFSFWWQNRQSLKNTVTTLPFEVLKHYVWGGLRTMNLANAFMSHNLWWRDNPLFSKLRLLK